MADASALPIQRREVGQSVEEVKCANCDNKVPVKKGIKSTVYCSEKCYEEYQGKRG